MTTEPMANARVCQEIAWSVAIASNFITGLIILFLCLFGDAIRKNTPGVALLSSISAVGFTYLTLNQYLSVAAVPMVSFLPLAIITIGYYGKGVSNASTLSLNTSLLF
jgi:xanthine/uracil/vitamin C permease (AzgA family)